MKPEVKCVRDFWAKKVQGATIDTDVLSDCVAALTLEERALLRLYAGQEQEPKADVLFLLSKVFNRHNDVCKGNTAIVKTKGNYVVEITPQSSISELVIGPETLRDCNKADIYLIEDVNKEVLPTLSFEAIADLTSAILQADQVQTSDDGSAVVCTCEKPCAECACAAKE